MRYWQEPYLGIRAIPRNLTQFEFNAFFAFSASERRLISARRDRSHRVGLALHIGFMRMSGRQLSSVRTIPPLLLQHLGAALKVDVPDIASIRSLYSRAKTLSDHQRAAAKLLGFSRATEHQRRALVRFLREQVQVEFNRDRLLMDAKAWLYENKIVIEHERSLRSVIDTAVTENEAHLSDAIRKEVAAERLQRWLETPTAGRANGESTQRWLVEGPRRQSVTQLKLQFERVAFLTELGADKQALTCLSDQAKRYYAGVLAARPPSVSARIEEPRRTLEVACFIQTTLFSATDTLIAMTRQAIVDLWNKAKQQVIKAEAERGKSLASVIKSVRDLAEDSTLSEVDLRAKLLQIVADCSRHHPPSRAAATRERLLQHNRAVRALLHRLGDLPFEGQGDPPVLRAMATLKTLYASKCSELPADNAIDMGRVWADLLKGDDRALAMQALEVATLLGLRRALKNGSVYIAHSFAFRDRESMLIDAKEWSERRHQHQARMKLPRDPKEFTEPLVAKVAAGVKTLAEVLDAGKLTVEDGEIRASALGAEEISDDVGILSGKLFEAVADTQLPEVMLEVDSHVRYSWILLGREPRSADELLLCYAALLAQATALTPTDTARMMRGFSPQAISQAISMMQRESRLREANAGVFEYMHSHRIAEHWGRADLASSDMMSLETARNLWNSRADPRRKTPSHGAYSHLWARWGIFYDCPIVLNERQVGVALEGAIRQDLVKLGQLAVDTHGYTDYGMLQAKLQGFDLCPRLKDLKQRKLYLPVDFVVPEGLQAVALCSVHLDAFEASWDETTRLAASIRIGKLSAIDAMFRFGSAARGLPLYDAGVQAGRLLRTVFLCDWYTNPQFQRELMNALARGESVHTLQRTLHDGRVPRGHSRRAAELKGVSSSLALLSNIVMAWNTAHMQHAWDALAPQDRKLATPDNLRHIAPVHNGHINMRGELLFPLESYISRILPSQELVVVSGRTA
jgi:TnpA family transposase